MKCDIIYQIFTDVFVVRKKHNNKNLKSKHFIIQKFKIKRRGIKGKELLMFLICEKQTN